MSKCTDYVWREIEPQEILFYTLNFKDLRKNYFAILKFLT